MKRLSTGIEMYKNTAEKSLSESTTDLVCFLYLNNVARLKKKIVLKKSEDLLNENFVSIERHLDALQKVNFILG